MSAKRAAPALALFTLLTLLAGGLAWLFVLRFESGDHYPPYSTLRADPLGARALHDSLVALRGGPRVERNRVRLCKLGEGSDATLMLLGVQPDGWLRFGEDEARHVEAFLISGGRVVLALAPQTVNPGQSFLEPRDWRRDFDGHAVGESDMAATVTAAADSTTITARSISRAGAEAEEKAEAERRKRAEEAKASPKPAPT